MKSHSYIKRRNASVIAFSPSFQRAVKSIRSELGIPSEGLATRDERDDWYKRHHAKSTKKPLRPMPSYYWHFPKQFVERIDSFSYSAEPSRVNYYSDVPLDRCAMDLVKKFDLPEEAVSEVKANILGVRGSLGLGSSPQLILVPISEGEEGTKYMALVAGIDEGTTQKDWLEIWKSFHMILRMSGISTAFPKRPVDKLLLRDLSFWKQVHAGKSAKEIANEWTDKHPSEKTIGEDTVRKAVERVDEIMRPDL